MRDPMNWAFPIFRSFGVPVKLHICYLIFILGHFLRQASQPTGQDRIFEIFVVTIPLWFGLVLLHEFGHCFVARMMDGEAKEVILWPLGGLAFPEVPRHWWAHTFTAMGGPLVNMAICLLCFVAIAGAGFFPTLNPFGDPYVSEMRNYKDGRIYTSQYGMRLYEPGTAEPVKPSDDMASKLNDPTAVQEATVKLKAERAVAQTWLVWVNRVFWLSWVLLLLALIPGYPLDGGQILQGIVWARSSYTNGIAVAAYSGYVAAVLMLIASFASNEVWPMALGLFIAFGCWMKMNAMELEDSEYGDFSQGYLSLDQDEIPPPQAKRQGLIKRWVTARNVKRMQREMDEQHRDEERMDQLLDKIARQGKASLTEEENRFMKRVSTRYKNR